MGDLAELIVRWNLAVDISDGVMSEALRDMIKDTIAYLKDYRVQKTALEELRKTLRDLGVSEERLPIGKD